MFVFDICEDSRICGEAMVSTAQRYKLHMFHNIVEFVLKNSDGDGLKF